MPKLLTDLRQRIISEAKTLLLRNGFGGLAIREVASNCKIAAGTVYNYFTSKEALAAAVMTEDWENVLLKLRAEIQSAPTVEGGLELIYGALRDFIYAYSSVRDSYKASPDQSIISLTRHKALITQLCGVLETLFVRFGCGCEAFGINFIAENLLRAASDEENGFDKYLAVFKRII